MDNNDKKKFLEIMNGLADIYTANLSTIGLQMRFDALKQYTIEQVTEASNVIVRTRVYTTMPVPADFIKVIDGDPDEIADIQKSIVMEAINRYQPDQKFDDPITEDIIKNKIGWWNIGQSSSKEISFTLKDFKEMYKAYNKAASGNMLNAPDRIKKLLPTLTKGIE